MPSRSIHSVRSRRTSSTLELLEVLAGGDGLAQELDDRDALDRLGVLEGEEDAGLGARVGRPRGDVLAAQQDLARGHHVAGVAHHDVGERRLAGPVGSHERVDLALAHHQVDAAQDARPSASQWRFRVPGGCRRNYRWSEPTGGAVAEGPGAHQPRSTHSSRCGRLGADGRARRRGPGRPGCRARRRERAGRSIERMMVAKSPPSKEVLPGPPGKRVSPVKSRGVPSTAKEIDPGVWPGVARVRRRRSPTT